MFYPINKGTPYKYKELMMKYIKINFKNIGDIEQYIMIVPKRKFDEFRDDKKNEIYIAMRLNTLKKNTLIMMKRFDYKFHIDYKEMQKIVNNGILISDSFPAGEVSELFIETLKENANVWYDGKERRIDEFPMHIWLENQTIKIIYIYKEKNSKVLNCILNKYSDSILVGKWSYHFNTKSNKEEIKDFLADKNFSKIFESLERYEKECSFDPIIDYTITCSTKRYLEEIIRK